MSHTPTARPRRPALLRRALDPVLRCFRCGSRDVVYNHCKVFCRTCGALIENCAGD